MRKREDVREGPPTRISMPNGRPCDPKSKLGHYPAALIVAIGALAV
jgi:hypothetical protein